MGLAAAGCSGASSGGAAPTSAASSPATGATAREALTVTDAWVRSTDGTAGTSTMTSMYGVLRNPGSTQVAVTGARSDVAGMVELHETVRSPDGATRMQPKAEGLLLPPGGSLTLAPGGAHVMLMDLRAPIRSGSDVTVTLTTSAGDVRVTAPARAFAGGQETYAPGSSRP